MKQRPPTLNKQSKAQTSFDTSTMHMAEINENYVSEYTPHAMANSSM